MTKQVDGLTYNEARDFLDKLSVELGLTRSDVLRMPFEEILDCLWSPHEE